MRRGIQIEDDSSDFDLPVVTSNRDNGPTIRANIHTPSIVIDTNNARNVNIYEKLREVDNNFMSATSESDLIVKLRAAPTLSEIPET